MYVFKGSNDTRMSLNLSQNLEKKVSSNTGIHIKYGEECAITQQFFFLYAFTLDLPICIYFLYRINFSLIQELFYLLDREEDLI